jgi:hypothetical protein
MSRKLIAVLLSSTLSFGSISTSAWSAGPTHSNEMSRVQTALLESKKNIPPLSPAGAAGIREAQGAGNQGWILGGFIAVYLLLVLLDGAGDDDDDDDAPSGTQ